MYCDYCPNYVAAPSAPNIMLDEIRTTLTSIHVAWSQQSDDFIKGFTITANYTGPCRDFASTVPVNVSPTKREVDITSLQEHSNYTIVITAFNDAEANFSRIENVQTRSSGRQINVCTSYTY